VGLSRLSSMEKILIHTDTRSISDPKILLIVQICIRVRVKYRSRKGWALAVGDLKAAAKALPLERRPR
jgi:hypothetical protein